MSNNKYAQSALKAVNYMEKINSAEDAWEKATSEIFDKGTSAQKKSCPKCAFLGLCSKDPDKQNGKNAQYARKAIKILNDNKNRNKTYTKQELWALVGEGKQHNSQMDVVLALWEAAKSKPHLLDRISKA